MSCPKTGFTSKTSLEVSDSEIERSVTLKDPYEVLTVLKERYKRKKNLFRETKGFYSTANLFVFFLPLLLAQSVTTILSHLAERPDIEDHSGLKAAIAALNGVMSIWTASQLKFGWAEKSRAASSAMMRFRDIFWQVDLQESLLRSYPFTNSEAMREPILEVLKDSYRTEMAMCSEKDACVPHRIYKKHKKGALEEAAKIAVVLGIEKTSEKNTGETSRKENLSGILKPKAGSIYVPTNDLEMSKVLRSLNTRFWRLKNMYRQTAELYFALNLYFFYLPLLGCGIINTIVPAVMMNEENANVNLIITAVSVSATILTSLQMRLSWGTESTKCEEAFRLYQKLEAEVNYQLLLSQQEVQVVNPDTMMDFIWKTRNQEHKSMNSLPYIPKFVYRKWSILQTK